MTNFKSKEEEEAGKEEETRANNHKTNQKVH